MNRIGLLAACLWTIWAVSGCALFENRAERDADRAAQKRLIVLGICGDYEGSANTTYLEIDGRDPDKELLTTLRRRGLTFVKGSEYPGLGAPVDSALAPEKLSIGGFDWIDRDTVEVSVVRGTETRYSSERLRLRRDERGVWRLLWKEGRHFP